jgi:transposase
VRGHRASQVVRGHRASQVVRGHRASQVVQSLEISKSTIYRLLKSWRICGDTENISRTGRKQIVTKRAENTLSMVVKMSGRATLKDITAEFNERVPVAVSPRTVQRKLHFFHHDM